MENLELGAVIVSLTEIVKKLEVIPSNWLPLVAVVIGVFFSIGMSTGTGQPLETAIIQGLMAGAVSTGLVSTAGSISKKTK